MVAVQNWVTEQNGSGNETSVSLFSDHCVAGRLRNFSTTIAVEYGTMYAKSSSTPFYHLLTEDKDHTLCGRSVVPIVIDRPAKTSSLHLTSDRPPDRELCKECAKIDQDQVNDGTTS